MKQTTKKKLAVFALLLAIAVIGAMRLSVSAGEKAFNKDTDVKVDYVNETITVYINKDASGNKDEVVYFTETYNKDISRWDVCDVRKITKDNATVDAAVFDISWLTNKKNMRLYLCGDVHTEVISVDIIWQEDFKVEFTGTLLTTDITEADEWKRRYAPYNKFSEDTGYFLFSMKENGRYTSYFELENIQWRKGDDGVWREMAELDLKEMNIRGINLEFRVVASNDVTTPARASSTAKITLSKLMSAPAIAINPNIMALGIKNGMEFSFDKENWIMIPEYNKKFGTEDYLVTESVRENAIETIYTSERITTLLIQEVLKTQNPNFKRNTALSKTKLKEFFDTNGPVELADDGIVLYVRDIGTGRKAASRISEVIIPYASENMAEAVEGALQISYGESKTNSSGIVVENTADVRYQVGVITKDVVTAEEWTALEGAQYDDLNLANVKWTTIKAGKTYRISNKKVPMGAYIVYRIAAEEGQLPSTYCVYGPMEYNEMTFAEIAEAKKLTGETLEAMVSTNIPKDENGNYEGLSFQWQRSANKMATEEEWTQGNIVGATGQTYVLAESDKDQYVRVVVTQKVTTGGKEKTIEIATEPVGPIVHVPPKEEENGNAGN